MTYEFFQTVALCISSIALVVIALAMVIVALRFMTFISPFDFLSDLQPLEDIEDDVEEIEVLSPQKKRRSGRKM